MVSAAKWREDTVRSWLEEKLQSEVVALAQQLGWMHYHTYRSKRSPAGWPDLALARPRTGGLLFRELKRQGQHPTPAQREWIEALRLAGQDVGVWRPEDWLSGRIERELRGG